MNTKNFKLITMKKSLTLFAFSLTILTIFTSCNKEDDQVNSDTIEQKYLSKIIYIENGNPDYTYEHNFIYNADKTLKEIIWEYYLNDSFNEMVTYRLNYDANNRINKVDIYSSESSNPDIPETITISYDSNGFVNQYNAFPVTYNEISKTYTININGNNRVYTFNELFDISQFENLSFLFNSNQKGPGFNRTQQNDFMFITRIFMSDNLLLPMSKKPIVSKSNSFTTINYTNEFDEEGFLIKSVDNNNNSYEFNYIKL